MKTSPWHWSLALISTLTLAAAAGPALAQGGSAYGNSTPTASLPVEPLPYHPGFDGSFWFLRSKSGSTRHKVFAYVASHKNWSYTCRSTTFGDCFFCPLTQCWFYKYGENYLPVSGGRQTMKTIRTSAKPPIKKPGPPYMFPSTPTTPKPGQYVVKTQTWYFTWPAHYPKLDNGLPVPPPGAITDPAPLPPDPAPATGTGLEVPGATVPALTPNKVLK